MRREVERFIHVDSRDFPQLTESSYSIIFGRDIPVQDYNNVIKIELKSLVSKKPNGEDYVFFRIKNVDGKVDSTTNISDATTICYFDSDERKPIHFDDNYFIFNPPISKLSKLEIDIIKRDKKFCDISVNNQSFVLKITYIEGNLY